MMDFLYKRCRNQFGPGGQFTPWDFRAADALQSSVAPALDGSPRSSASNSNYVKLPDVFALGASEWYADGIASSLLKLEGFCVLRNFIPKYMCQPAREDAEAHVLNVLRSFTGGHAVENIDDVHKLDGKV